MAGNAGYLSASKMTVIVLLFAFFLISVVHSSDIPSCYYPNGEEAPNDIPCHPNQANSTCCEPGYACLDNNICQRTSEVPADYDPGVKFYRGTCTDSSWSSDKCPGICTGGNNGRDQSIIAVLCTEHTWCCGGDRCDCGSGKGTVSLAAGTSAFTTIGLVPSATSTARVSSTNANKTHTTAAPSNTSVSADEIDPSDHAEQHARAVRIGAGVGVPLGVALLGALGFFLWRDRRRKKAVAQLQQQLRASETPMAPYYSPQPPPGPESEVSRFSHTPQHSVTHEVYDRIPESEGASYYDPGYSIVSNTGISPNLKPSAAHETYDPITPPEHAPRYELPNS